MFYFEAFLTEERLKILAKDFPFKYVGGGYFRDNRVAKGKTAEIIHGDEVVERLIKHLINE